MASHFRVDEGPSPILMFTRGAGFDPQANEAVHDLGLVC